MIEGTSVSFLSRGEGTPKLKLPNTDVLSATIQANMQNCSQFPYVMVVNECFGLKD